jgi:hypothetical protein
VPASAARPRRAAAVAGKDGRPWLARANVPCLGPELAADLVELTAAVKLACFAGQPIPPDCLSLWL